MEFSDGTVEDVDVILCATGYKMTLPFLVDGITSLDAVPLFLHTLHPEYRSLFFAGFFAAIGAAIPLVERQAQTGSVWTYGQGSANREADPSVDRLINHR